MEREILFRGKRMDNGEWVEGYYNLFQIGGNPVPVIIPYAPLIETLQGHWIYQIDPATVGQYTGLTDKNGQKIFEGDIVREDEPGDQSGEHLPVFGVLRFGKYKENYSEHFGFFVEWKDNEEDNYSETYTKGLYYWSKHQYFQVIGNIHDNPELLEVHNGTV